MAYYKNYLKEYIGASDAARLLVEGVNDEGIMDVKRLNFGEDGSYNAYIVDARCEIPSHYQLQFSFNDFILLSCVHTIKDIPSNSSTFPLFILFLKYHSTIV